VLLLVTTVMVTCGVIMAVALWQHYVEPVFSSEQREEYVTAVRSSSPPIFYAVTQEKKVALTLDISWGEKQLPKVLGVLADRGTKATFFISSPWAVRHPDFVQAITMGGHEVGTHGHKHINLSQYDLDTVRDNIGKSIDIVESMVGTRPKFFRPPNGDYDDVVVDVARELGAETVIWSIDSLDWKNPGVGYMVTRIKKELFPGAILLFHASDSAEQTHEALPVVLQTLAEEGYQVLTLGELLEQHEPARIDPRGRPTKPNM